MNYQALFSAGFYLLQVLIADSHSLSLGFASSRLFSNELEAQQTTFAL
jgi:hypothetical protein